MSTIRIVKVTNQRIVRGIGLDEREHYLLLEENIMPSTQRMNWSSLGL